jgi:hypothetical protein
MGVGLNMNSSLRCRGWFAGRHEGARARTCRLALSATGAARRCPVLVLTVSSITCKLEPNNRWRRKVQMKSSVSERREGWLHVRAGWRPRGLRPVMRHAARRHAGRPC